MSDQISFVEPLKRARRKTNKPEKIAQTISRLAEWYAVNKPGLRSMTISANDAYSIRTLWAKKDAKTNGEQECRQAGFHIAPDGSITWRSFDLLEAK